MDTELLCDHSSNLRMPNAEIAKSLLVKSNSVICISHKVPIFKQLHVALYSIDDYADMCPFILGEVVATCEYIYNTCSSAL